MNVFVTDAPYFAKGNGITNDRAAIQQAIDDVHAAGGGTVTLTENKTFLSGNLILRSNVELQIAYGATLLQSNNRDDYIKPTEHGYEPCPPEYGYNLCAEIKWSHLWYYNYPFLYAEPGTHDFKITGTGMICMAFCTDKETLLRICPIGFYRVHHVEIRDVIITNYHSYAMMCFTSKNILVKDIRVNNSSNGNGDGICLMNSQNVRITGCRMTTGDDSIYIFSSYKDPRASQWWSSEEPQASKNIEIDHNDLDAKHCKAFGMILWGIECPDQEKMEVRNLYVHDNHFRSMGNWLYNPYTTKQGFPPVTNVRFENNKVDGIEINFFETQISDMNYYRSMTAMHNEDFKDGIVFWSTRENGGEDSVGVCREEIPYGYIRNLDKGDAAIYQGLYLKSGLPLTFRATVRSSGETCRLFVKDLDTQELIAKLPFSNTDWEEKSLEFTVPKNGNYHIGLETGNATSGWAEIRRANLLGNPGPDYNYPEVMDEKYDKKMYLYPDPKG